MHTLILICGGTLTLALLALFAVFFAGFIFTVRDDGFKRDDFDGVIGLLAILTLALLAAALTQYLAQ